MGLATGTRLGPYEITGPLGAGGMGEVYVARDARLGRDVAIKILPAEVSQDPERLARFEREAKAVSALNHPHIVTLYEVGSSEAGPYLVLEKIEGQSLRELLRAGSMPPRRVVALASQIAEGLAKAHGAGIVHRDLKPENVMVTADGFAKILDFGLAKQTWTELDGAALDAPTTLMKGTASGMILGTVGYLAPEQAAGRPVDYHADQFALGVLIYEMATGDRPFRRDTLAESLAATIRDDHEPLRTRRPELPAQLEWLVDRCLAKDPNDRYASTTDLARDLNGLRDHWSALMRQPADAAPAAPTRAKRWLPAAIALTLIAGAAASGFFVARRAPADPPPSYRPLTFKRGTITGARFGPDGKTVYYSAAYGAEPSRVYITHTEGTESEPLNVPAGFLLAVSSKNELALLVTNERATYASPGTLVRVPAIGGTPRRLTENVFNADWAPDGDRLAIAHDRHTLEFPVGHVLPASSSWVRVSPTGDRLAWMGLGVVVADSSGTVIVRDEITSVFGLAWTRDGREVWFTGSERGSGSDRALYALSMSGARRLLARVAGAMTIYDVGPDGHSALIGTGFGWAGLSAARVDQPGREQSLDLLGRSLLAGLSGDGKWLLASEGREVGSGAYLRSTDGTQTVHLSNDIPLALSPDGGWALIQPRGRLALMLVPTGAGAAREVPLNAGLESLSAPGAARWSQDGRRLFAWLRSTGRGSGSARVYLYENSGPWRPVTPELPINPFVASPDGAQVAALDDSGAVVLFPVDGGTVKKLDGERGTPIHWSADGGTLFLAGRLQFPMHVYRRNLTTGRVEPWRDVAPPDASGVMYVQQLFLARDEQSYVYMYSRGLNDLYLVTGIR